MKVFVFQGGLGNQIFEYAYYQHELKKNPHLKYLFPKVLHKNIYHLLFISTLMALTSYINMYKPTPARITEDFKTATIYVV